MNDNISWTSVGVIVAVLALCTTIGGFGLAVMNGINRSEVSLSKMIADGDTVLTEKVNVIQNQLGIVMASQIRDLPQRIALLEQANSKEERFKRSDATARVALETAEFKAVWKEIERLRTTQILGENELKAWLQRLRDGLTTHVDSES